MAGQVCAGRRCCASLLPAGEARTAQGAREHPTAIVTSVGHLSPERPQELWGTALGTWQLGQLEKVVLGEGERLKGS